MDHQQLVPAPDCSTNPFTIVVRLSTEKDIPLTISSQNETVGSLRSRLFDCKQLKISNETHILRLVYLGRILQDRMAFVCSEQEVDIEKTFYKKNSILIDKDSIIQALVAIKEWTLLIGSVWFSAAVQLGTHLTFFWLWGLVWERQLLQKDFLLGLRWKIRKHVASIIARTFFLCKLYYMSDNRKRPIPSNAPGFPSKRANRLSYGMDRLTLNNDEAASSMGPRRSFLDHDMMVEPQTAEADQPSIAAEASTSAALIRTTYTQNQQSTPTNNTYIRNRPQLLLERFTSWALSKDKANSFLQIRIRPSRISLSHQIQWTWSHTYH